MKKRPIYIFAGTMQQAQYWADQWRLDPRSWLYLSDVHKLYGTENPDVRECGTPWERKDYNEMKMMIRTRQKPKEPTNG